MITSHSNPAIKTIRGLRDKKARTESELFLIEGLRIVAEALEGGGRVQTLIYAPELLISDFGKNLIFEQLNLGMDLLEVSEDVFKSVSNKEGPQGLAAVVRQDWTDLETVQLTKDDLWVALDSVADPGNLGTILRTLDAVGGKGVFLLDHCTDPYDATAIRASMGALFRNRFVKTTFEDFSVWAGKNGYQIVGTSDKADTDYQEIDYPDPVILLMGSERQGLSQTGMSLCQKIVRIPMVGSSDSLNLAVAAGVVLYEIFNQKRRR
ncbi:MAG: TrmH family RNA methyltransferase [Anaerolineaceae bacterium]